MSMLTSTAKRQYFRELLDAPDITLERMPEIGSLEEFSSQSYILTLAQVVNFEIWVYFSPDVDREGFLNSIVSIGNNLWESTGNGLLIALEHGQFAVLFSYKNAINLSEMLREADFHMRLLAPNLHKLLEIRLEWVVGQICTDLRQLLLSRQALNKQINYPAVADDKNIGILDEKELVSALSMLDFSRTDKQLLHICQSCMTAHKELPQQIIYRLLEIGIRYQESQKIMLIKDMDSSMSIRARLHMGGMEVVQFLRDYFRDIISSAMDGTIEAYSSYVKKAIFFIYSHYMEDISLTLLAEELTISPAHLSRLFRKETGVAFIDHLISYRIKVARQLMKTTELSLSEIAIQSGFNGYNYFLRCYKQRTGTTAAAEMANLR